MLRDEELEKLEEILFPLLDDDAVLGRMASASAALGRPHAAYEIAEAVTRLDKAATALAVPA